jgi:hypothetical protein
MKTNIWIVVLSLIPAFSFAVSPENSISSESSYVQSASSEKIELENWMTDLTTWTAKAETFDYSSVEQLEVKFKMWNYDTYEAEIRLESWMLNPVSESWNTKEEEQEIKVEEWMYMPSDWLKN